MVSSTRVHHSWSSLANPLLHKSLVSLNQLGLVILPDIPGTLEMVGHRKSERERRWAMIIVV